MTSPEAERTPRVQWALDAMRTLHAQVLRSPRHQAFRDETAERFLARLEHLLENLADSGPDYEYDGREVLKLLQANHPELWETLDRRLLWFFGGDCLHFLSDEEIERFSAEAESDA